ncbi:MAG: fimbria/pilus outer membrane usher protein [Leptolyngbyaceae bacterium]|nr:fimbria/pilus outer membrane usher protein [Leptolyngbyaceae bacterium]
MAQSHFQLTESTSIQNQKLSRKNGFNSNQSFPVKQAPDQPEQQVEDPTVESVNAETEAVNAETEVLTEDELFEQIFGGPRPQSQAVVVPFVVDEQNHGDVLVVLDGGRVRRIQAQPVLDIFEDILQPELYNQLQSDVDETGYLQREKLQDLGLVVIFDQSRLELEFQVPATLRQTNVIGRPDLPPEAARAIPPSDVSGYVNFRGGEDVIWAGSGFGNTGRQPLRLNVDGALNVRGWVLEGSANWTENADPAVVRGDVRLVRDDPDRALRYVLGDVSPPVTGFFQTAVPLAGLSVSRNYDLQPYRVTRPVGEYTFFLERPATVDVLVNGARVQQLRLNAGPQDIRNLSLSTGANDIQLVITDDLGRVQRLDFSIAIAGNLLAPGLQQFSYNLGFPSDLDIGDRTYDVENPTLSASHRWGVTDQLTVGGYGQVNLDYQLLGTEGIWATPAGNLGWELAASHTDEWGVDWATRLQYEVVGGATNPNNRTFRTAIEYRGANFTSLNTLEPSDYRLDLSAFYSQQIFGSTNASISGSYRLGRDEPDTYNLYLGLSRSLGDRLNGNVNLAYRRNVEGESEVQTFFGLSWIFPQKRQSLSLNTELSNTDEANHRLSWSMGPRRPVQGFGTTVDISHDADSYDLTGRFTYTNYRFEVGLTQDLAFYDDGSGDRYNATQFTFGTAIAFADGHFGWTRPITNSFVMVAPHPNWRDQVIRVNPEEGGALALADGWGPAILPDLQPYYVSRVILDAPDAPLGYDLGEFSHVVLPSYRSGTLIRAGTDATVLIRGILREASGEPIALQTGPVISLSDPDWQTQVLFTNRVGRFALPGFKPGQYEIQMGDRPPIQFEIPAEQTGLYDLETLTFDR